MILKIRREMHLTIIQFQETKSIKFKLLHTQWQQILRMMFRDHCFDTY